MTMLALILNSSWIPLIFPLKFWSGQPKFSRRTSYAVRLRNFVEDEEYPDLVPNREERSRDKKLETTHPFQMTTARALVRRIPDSARLLAVPSFLQTFSRAAYYRHWQ